MSNTIKVQKAIEDVSKYLLNLSDKEFNKLFKNHKDHGYINIAQNMIEANIQECEAWGDK